MLREVFEFPYDEIAQAVDKSMAAVRQIAHRAREHVSARRPRGTTTAAETRAALAAFQHAVQTGDLQDLMDILAPDVIALSDGGGIRQAMTRPVVGIDKVARLLTAHAAVLGPHESIQPVTLNGCPALIVRLNGEIDGVVTMRIEDGLITELYFVRNPEKLSRVEREFALSR